MIINFSAYRGMMTHLLDGYMGFSVVSGCLAHFSSWIAIFCHFSYRLLIILKHSQNILIWNYRKWISVIPETGVSMKNQERLSFEPLNFIIRSKSKSTDWERLAVNQMFVSDTSLLNSSRLFHEIDAVYSGVLFAQLVCGTWFIAASLFQMDMVRKKQILYIYFKYPFS